MLQLLPRPAHDCRFAGSQYSTAPNFTLLFPQFGNGGGLVSDLVLTNTAAVASSVRVEFRGNDGAPLNLGVGSGAYRSQYSRPGRYPAWISHSNRTGPQESRPTVWGTRLLRAARWSISDQRVGGVDPLHHCRASESPESARRSSDDAVHCSRAAQGRDDQHRPGTSERRKPLQPDLELRLLVRRWDGRTQRRLPRLENLLWDQAHLSKFIDELFPDAATDNFEGSAEDHRGHGVGCGNGTRTRQPARAVHDAAGHQFD